jgi:hypothetical protein
MIQAGTIWPENGVAQNAVCDLEGKKLEFRTYDGMLVLSLHEQELVNILREHPALLATVIMNSED